ncbi:hypothetical protein LINGRAHAP2_LOCUS4481 [Linum grandiflorum]
MISWRCVVVVLPVLGLLRVIYLIMFRLSDEPQLRMVGKNFYRTSSDLSHVAIQHFTTTFSMILKTGLKVYFGQTPGCNWTIIVLVTRYHLIHISY